MEWEHTFGLLLIFAAWSVNSERFGDAFLDSDQVTGVVEIDGR